VRSSPERSTPTGSTLSPTSAKAARRCALPLRANANLGDLEATFDAFNLLNQEASQIDYVCRSRLASETGEVEGIHFHPLESRSFRLSLTKQW
jgi:hypothetical protein